ncbi:MBL fold metallo-hydrolase [Pelagibacterales bacterium SAG-MED39]|nr:MBL fold metallo-hydrolase [Pelagibacterales bacterium SAG-MED39]
MKFVILGCGSSMGVPRTDGFFGNCNPKNRKNYRTRCSAVLKSKLTNILFDTSPDLRNQLLSNNIKDIHKVLFTHMHADQTHGINDLRIFYLKNKKKLPIYADVNTRKYLLKSFSYCFKGTKSYPAILKFFELKKKLYFNESINIQTVPVKHGLIESMSFIINNKLAYLPDTNKIYMKDYKFFKNLEYMVIDCLRFKPHPSHYNLTDVLKIYEILKPNKMFLTNLHSDLDYNKLLLKLPKKVKPAYDGLTLNL